MKKCMYKIENMPLKTSSVFSRHWQMSQSACFSSKILLWNNKGWSAATRVLGLWWHLMVYVEAIMGHCCKWRVKQVNVSVVDINFIIGSLVLIHGTVLHRSAENKSEKSRHAYTFHIVEQENTEWSKQNW